MSRLIVLLAAVAGVLATARLGLWQLDRAAQKREWDSSLHERGTLAPIRADELARNDKQMASQLHRRIELRGRWMAANTVFLDNRPMNGRAGFIMTTPLLIGPGDAVLIQRGWIARDAADPRLLPPLPTATGDVSVTGRIAWPPSHMVELAPSASGSIRQNLELGAYGREIGVPLRPLSVLQDADPGRNDGLLHQWPSPASDVAKHNGYAFQWFALSVLIAGLYVWFQLIVTRRRPRP
jgi:surfeit locus 1 family protein